MSDLYSKSGAQKKPAVFLRSSIARLYGYWLQALITLLLSFAMGWGFIPPFLAEAKVYRTKEEAIKQAFPDADAVEKETVFLNDEEKKQAEELGRVKLDSKVFTFYIGKKGKNAVGYAVFGSHIVRTKPEVYVVVINPDGSLRHVEILAFYEPQEYLPFQKWFEQFAGKVLDDSLWPKRGIHAVAGATLSVNGITQEVRKTLAVFKVMILKDKGEVK